MLGLGMFGLGIAFMVQGDLGLSPWDVLHEGVAERSGLAIGTVTIATGVVVLLLWLPLRERMGIGTVANALVIGLVVNAGIAVLPEPEHMAARIAFLLFGIFLFGPRADWQRCVWG